MISEWGPYFNPVCDVCGRMLPAVVVRNCEGGKEAARAAAREKMAADGWASIANYAASGGKIDICTLCAREGRRPKGMKLAKERINTAASGYEQEGEAQRKTEGSFM